MHLDIRKANLQDLDDLLSLTLQLIQAECRLEPNLEDESDTPASILIQLKEQLSAVDIIFLVAEHSSKIVGFVEGGLRGIRYKGTVVYLNRIVVDEAYRHLGIGDKLMDEFAIEAKKLGGDYIALQVLDRNKTAKKLYKKQGFYEHTIRYMKKI